jgi:hypothetical protein
MGWGGMERGLMGVNVRMDRQLFFNAMLVSKMLGTQEIIAVPGGF